MGYVEKYFCETYGNKGWSQDQYLNITQKQEETSTDKRLIYKNSSIEEKKEIEKQVGNLLQRNLIEESYSPFSAPVTLAFKKKTKRRQDASLEGIGAILKQIQPNGKEKPVAYFSKKLNEAQKKKKAIYLECLAIKEAVKYWQYWLIGKHFTVYSDHKPLENMNIKSRIDEELGEFTYYLSQYDFKIKYAPGKDNLEADCLSRNPVLEAVDDTDEQLRIVNLIQLQDVTLVNKIRCKINERNNKTAWTTIAHTCVNKYNDTVHTVTGFTPRYLLEGTEVSFLPEELKQSKTAEDWMIARKIAFENSVRIVMRYELIGLISFPDKLLRRSFGDGER
ncbi:hypothetical protein EVAR_50589_1 [Eumeta japonica]|uniref:Reverse transcriptase RNase H-like domain-containing protein n=1 Tax=Eumeta variegata TaxID=151549 RepID=A0A4C1YA68_EUMVA|nr:hypothetical protein EVAR_50589_1 [Eumeta japonica]